MAEESVGEKVCNLALKLKRLLEEAAETRKAIEKYGFAVVVERTVNPETMETRADVTVWEPKDDMGPEEAALYDRWFQKKAEFRIPPEKGEPG